MDKKQKNMTEEQRKNLELINTVIKDNTPLITNLVEGNKAHERKMFNREILFGSIIVFATGLLAYFGKLSGETLAGLIGVIIGYVGARNV